MHPRTLNWLVTPFALFSIALASGCDDGETPYNPAPTGETFLQRSDAQLGSYVAAADGMTLYVFMNDTKATGGADPVSACTGGCLDNWPVHHAHHIEVVDALDAADFGEFTRADGSMQSTYKGWPLYRFGGDAAVGDVNGHSEGGPWIAAGTPVPQPVAAETLLEGNDATLGTYVTDGAGNTLYVFTNDTKAATGADPVSACTDGCLDNWPVFYTADIAVGAGLDAADFGAYERADGSMQSTYKGWPLYHFSGDAEAGDINGHSDGGPWIAAGTPVPQPAPAAAVSIAQHDSLGNILVNAEGFTLYTFANDTPAAGGDDPLSDCQGGCLTTWPAFYAADLVLGDGLDAADFGAFQRGDGPMQTTYKGAPLYLYSGDASPGDANGNSAVWPVAVP